MSRVRRPAPPAETFLGRLRALRMRAGLTQHQLARRLGRSGPRWVYLRERGWRGIDVDDFAAWVRALGLNETETCDLLGLLARAAVPVAAAA